MKIYLWVIMLVGVWNFINLLARIYYKEWSNQYVYHVIIGAFAAYFLFS